MIKYERRCRKKLPAAVQVLSGKVVADLTGPDGLVLMEWKNCDRILSDCSRREVV